MQFLTVLLLLLPLADTFLTSSRYSLTFNRGKMISSSTSVQERKIMPSFTRLNYQEKDNSFQELTKNFNHLSQIAKDGKLSQSLFTYNLSSVLLVLFSQAIVLGIAYILQLFTGIDSLQTRALDFSSSSWTTGITYGALLGGAGLLFDKIPWTTVQKIRKDTQIYVLKLLGQDDSLKGTLVAIALSFAVSFAAGFTEEALFRGQLLPFISTWLNSHFPLTIDPALVLNSPFPSFDIISLIVTSIVFGLLHFPTFGLSAIIEIVLGGAFGLSFLASGGNILIPILIHTVYDFVTIFGSWKKALDELHQAEERSLNELSTLSMEQIAGKIFNFIDLNKDGSISEYEFNLGIKLLGIGWIPYPKIKDLHDSSEFFRVLDKNKDGKIQFDEFLYIFQDNGNVVQ